MTDLKQARQAKQKALVEQVRNVVGMIRGLFPANKNASAYAQLFEDLIDEIERLQNIVDKRSEA